MLFHFIVQPLLVLVPLFLQHLTLTAAAPLHSPHSNDTVNMNAVLTLLPASMRTAIGEDTGFLSAFLQSLLLILACELGDRTFFVAAILAMKSSRVVVWCGALAALSAMTILSAVIGKAFPLLLDKRYTSVAAACLFAYFGLHLFRDWYRMRGQELGENEELTEVEEELNRDKHSDVKQSWYRYAQFSALSPVFMKALSMTALAEWGDRSQIATIALAASKDVYGVILGGIIGHGICTGIAVVGGRLLATKISERAVALMGGVMFLSFAVLTASGLLD